MSTNGLRALEAISPKLLHSFYEAGDYQLAFNHHHEETGELVKSFDMQPMCAAQRAAGALPPLKMRWWYITRALEEALPEGMLHFGHKLVECVDLMGPQGQAASSAVGAAGSGAAESNSATYRYELSFRHSGPGATASSAAEGTEAGMTTATTTVVAKWLIGADGGFSRVRRTVRKGAMNGLLFMWVGLEVAAVGDGRAPAFLGTFSWWGSATESQLAAAGADWPLPLRGPPQPLTRNATYMPPANRLSTTGSRNLLTFRNPPCDLRATRDGGEGCREDVALWYMEAQAEAMEAEGVDASPEGPLLRHAADDGGAVALARALRMASHLPPDVRAFMAATPPHRVLEKALHCHPLDQQQHASWTNGRGMVLVGDAVHTSGRPDGQGGNLAFEDAAELAAHVRRHGLGQQAFDAFAAARLPRVTAIRGDCKPPFAVRKALVDGSAFEPLWGPQDLPSAQELEELGLEPERPGPAGESSGHSSSSAGTVSEEQRQRVLAWSLRRCWQIADRRTGGLLGAPPAAGAALVPQQAQQEGQVAAASVRA
ncbi:hypothetical protein CHLRE_17g724650v5 [Chlamydomonas reinhardtii]|uniref:FAD-binding domain-containing protein n=1 Tax=Chlamydomonas reinhardtii TaxID=3055 RepID=A0A2K3CQI9_CHLRE|nr:uncharacterized protein CHLRE_17g724650v5 [Chlamydomonas reinhardtii]PNW70552.1 hypothetical protein CHLRE_17g724650v5 [Chlamydomonas reinhardtii]